MLCSALPLPQNSHQQWPSILPPISKHLHATATFLCIPELLELVFAFVSQDTLRKTVILVCRKWFFLNRQRVSRELSWDFKWFSCDATSALTRLPGAGKLVWRCDQYSEETWQTFIKSLNNIEKEQLGFNNFSARGQDDSKADYFKKNFFRINSPLYHIELFSNYHLSDESLNLMGFPSTLTSLKIYRYSNSTFDIERIIVLCPHLITLFAGSQSMLSLQGAWTSQELVKQKFFPLQSLVLENVNLCQSWLERLVEKTPELKELKLINLSSPNNSTWNWPTLFQHLRLQPFTLHKFHYSVRGEIPSEDDLEDMLYSLCPNSSERTLWSYNLTSGIVRSITEQPSVLTKLDICWNHITSCHSDGWKEGNHFYSSTSLHRLLCESPGLRHLKFLKAPYLIEHMDIHHRIKAVYDNSLPELIEGTEIPIFHPGIWLCRNLQTLHLQVHSHGVYDLRGVYIRVVLLGYLSRTLFSYIAKVTPQLRDLHIEQPYSCSISPGIFSFRSYLSEYLFGGLPLLSTLQYLERLRIEFDCITCDTSQLSWICSTGRTLENKHMRQTIMSNWRGQLDQEAQIEANRLEGAVASPLFVNWSHDMKLLKDLESIGLLQEVKARIDAVDNDDSPCFPNLEKLSLNHELERSPEQCLLSIFKPRN